LHFIRARISYSVVIFENQIFFHALVSVTVLNHVENT
jgi:hypothetical protein